MGVCIARADTLVGQSNANMLGAQATTTAGQTTTGGVTTTTYRTSFMNDQPAGGPPVLGTANSNYTYGGINYTGTTSTATAGYQPVVFSGVSYTSVGSVYSSPSFWVSGGKSSAAGSAASASDAAIAFRIGWPKAAFASGSLLIGVDLVKRDDVAANPSAGTVGKANIDFYIGIYLSTASPGTTTAPVAYVFISGAPRTVTSIVGNVNEGPNHIIVGKIAGADAALIGATQYFKADGSVAATAETIVNASLVSTTGSPLAYLNAANATNYFITFGALLAQINTALATIYGSSGGTPNVQWNVGDAARFMPVTNTGNLAATPAAISAGDLMGGTGNFGITVPFGNNATGLITDSYILANDYSLTLSNTDGFGIGNHAPVADAQPSVSTAEDTAKGITLTGSDADGNSITYSTVTNPAHGMLSGTAPNLTYTPDTNYNGADSFTFRTYDGSLYSANATVTISITAVNDAPAVVAASGTTAATEQVAVAIDAGVTVSDVDNTTLGSATIAITGNFQSGQDVLAFTNDGSTMGNIAGSYTAGTGVLALSSAGATATLAQWQIALRAVTYTANSDTPTTANRTVSFTVSDGTASSNTGTKTVSVAAVNDAPVASAQTPAVFRNQSKAITLQATDAESNVLTYSVVANPSHGSLSGTIPNLTYTPTADYTGADSFTFRAWDGTAYSNTATVAITVTLNTGANVNPVNTVSSARTVNEDSLLTFTGASTLSVDDIDDNLASTRLTVLHGTLTVSVTGGASIGAGANGSATLTLTGTQLQINAALGTLVYQGGLDYNGNDTLAMLSTDSGSPALTDSDTIALTVSAVNDAPSNTVPGTQSVNEDTALAFTGAQQISVNDVEGNLATVRAAVSQGTLTVSLTGGATISAGTNGSSSLTLGGTQTQINAALATLFYQGSANYNGSDTLTVASVDSGTPALTTSSSINITVVAVNDLPVATDQSVTTNEDTAKAFTLAATDVEGSSLIFTVMAGPSHGEISGTAPNLTYTPSSNYNGVDSFTFKVNDGSADSSTNATVSLTINAVNDAPAANGQNTSTIKNVAKAITLTGTDVEGSSLSYTITVNPAHGTLSGTLPNLTYTPVSNYVGADSFSFVVDDGTQYSSEAVISITMINSNSAPVNTVPGSKTVNEDTAFAVTGISTTDGDGNLATVQLTVLHGTVTVSISGGATIAAGANGSATLTLAGTQTQINNALLSLSYRGSSNYNGADTLTMLTTDSGTPALTDSDTVGITINAVNDAPIATAQAVSATEDTNQAITLAGTDVDGNALTYTVVAGVSHGTLSGTAPNLTYSPTANYNGSDSFTFKVNDGTVDSASNATVSITVAAVNDLPLASAQSLGTAENTPTAVTLSGSDAEADALIYTVVSGPSHGALSGTAPNLTYTPTNGYGGADSFTFKVNDGVSDSASNATVSITVSSSNHAPVATAQTISTNEDTGKAITLAGTDEDGDALTFSMVTSPAHGVLSGTIPNLTYTPTGNFHGADSFTFRVNDGLTYSSTSATVSITVVSINDAPVAGAQTLNGAEDTNLSITLAGTDVDGDALTYTVVTEPNHGVLSGVAPNLLYTPTANYNGADSFTFKVNDGTVDSVANAVISISLRAVNDVPVATAQSVSATEDSDQAITLAGTDADGDGLTYTVVVEPIHGTLSGVGAFLTYTPDPDYNGVDSFTFKVNDGSADSSTNATVSLTINAVNDAPAANGQNTSTIKNVAKAITLTGTDVEGSSLSYTITVNPAHGTLSGTLPNLTYTPVSNYVGADSFSFVVDDGTQYSSEAVISITMINSNSAPVNTVPGSKTVNEDTAFAVTGISTTDGDGNLATVQLTVLHGTVTVSISGGATIAAGANGSATLTLAGTQTQINNALLSLSYRGSSNYNGADTLTMLTTDSGTPALTDSDTVGITINAVNDAPIATAQAVSATEDTNQAITLAGTDVDGNALTYTVVAGVSHGTLSGTAPNLTYSPTANYNGSDSFTFKVNDGTVDSASNATVSITVAAVNDLPLASAQSLGTAENTPTAVTLSGSDAEADALIYTVVSGPSHGALSGTAPNLTYTPTNGYGGADSFTFKVNDGVSDSASNATVSITVSSSNHAPVATAQTISTNEDTGKAITLAGTDEDGDALTFSMVTSPAHGVLSGTIPNLTYTPTGNFHGADSFTFRVNDGLTYSSTSATVSITVVSINDAPVAGAQTLNGAEDTNLSITLAGTDVDGDALTYTVVTEPNHGVLSGVAPNLLYTPTANYNGADSFTFKVNDGTVDSVANAVISISLRAVNDVPVATAQSVSATEDSDQAITLAGTDADGDGLTYTVVVEPIHGTLSGVGAFLTYTPDPDYNGADSFTFKVNDGTVDSASNATVSIAVAAVSDDSTISVTGADYPYDGAAHGPTSASVTGSTGAVTYSYAGTGSTSYGPSATRPTAAGSYTVTATVAADGAYLSASSSPTAFSIGLASSTVTVAGGSYIYDGSAQGPNSASVTGSTGAVTYSYAGTGGTSYGPSATRPSSAGSYTVIASVAPSGSYAGASSTPTAFTIAPASSSIAVTGGSYTYNGSAQGPNSASVTGSSGAVTYSYEGTGGTSYGPGATRPTAVGSYTVTATIAADNNYQTATSSAAAFSVISGTMSQVVTFPVLSDQLYGVAPIPLGATADSGLSVTYRVASGPATVSGRTLTITGLGTVVVEANQAGGTNGGNAYAAALAVQRTFSVSAGVARITWNSPTAISTATALSSTQLNATGSVAGTLTYSPAVGSFLSAGTHTLTVTLTPTDSGYRSTSAAVTILVWAIQAITFPIINNQLYGVAPLKLAATADSGLPISYLVTSGPATVSGNTLTITGTGTVVVEANQIGGTSGSTTYASAPAVQRAFAVGSGGATITWSNPAAMSAGTALSGTQLNAIGSVAGALTYSPAAGTILASGTHTLTVTLTPTNSSYVTTNATVTVRVLAAPSITAPVSIDVTPLNAAPIRTSLAGSVMITDSASARVTVELSVAAGTLSIPSLNSASVTDQGTITVSGSVDFVNQALSGLIYNANSSGAEAFSLDTLMAKVTGETGLSATATTSLFVTRQLLGGVTQQVDVLPLLRPNTNVSKLEMVSWDAAVFSQPPVITAQGELSLLIVDREDGSTIKTAVMFRVTYMDGSSENITATPTIYYPLLAELKADTAPNWGAASLNPQTGLYEQYIRLTNTTVFPMISFSITAPALPAGVTMMSASGYNDDGTPFISGLAELLPGDSLDLVLEYFSANMQPFPRPALQLLMFQAKTIPKPAGTLLPSGQIKVIVGYAGRNYVQFPSIIGYTYWVMYRDDASADWTTSTMPILGTGQPISWMDYGAPGTKTKPTNARIYQVLYSKSGTGSIAVGNNPPALSPSAVSPTTPTVTIAATTPTAVANTTSTGSSGGGGSISFWSLGMLFMLWGVRSRYDRSRSFV